MATAKNKIVYLKGDVLEPAKESGRPFRFIVHCVNNLGSFGSGVAGAIRKKWPHVAKAYEDKTNWGLGDIQYVEVDKWTKVVNLCGQRDIGAFYETKPIRYESIQDGLMFLREDIKFRKIEDKTVLCMPRMGAGLAGGSWEKIEETIERVFENTAIKLTVYDLPGVTVFNK